MLDNKFHGPEWIFIFISQHASKYEHIFFPSSPSLGRLLSQGVNNTVSKLSAIKTNSNVNIAKPLRHVKFQ